VIVLGAYRPNSNIEHFGLIWTLLKQGCQWRADIARRRLCDRREFKPVWVNTQPDEITDRNVQRC
jgi:hypothetical protein